MTSEKNKKSFFKGGKEMKKISKSLLAVILCFVMMLGVIACGGNKSNPDSNGGSTSTSEKTSTSTSDKTSASQGDGESTTIMLYTAVNAIEQSALRSVADAYSDYQYNVLGKDIQIVINNRTDPEAYMQAVRNMASTSVSVPSIVQTSIIPEYYGSNKIVDLTPYLEEANPYIKGNKAWKDALEPDAYRTKVSGASETIPGVSYSSNYLTVFYNKKAVLDVLGESEVVGKDGTIDNSKITWSWLISSLKKAKEATGKNFKNPLGLSRSEQSCGEGSFNMLSHLVNMYLDQYFRDFIEKVHSTSDDYSYVSVDADWTYDAADPSVDAVDKYSFNLNKVVDYYFNQTGYNPNSERYTEVMENLYDLMSYSDPDAAYLDTFHRFNETTLNYEKNASYADLKLFYVEALDYVRTYRDAFKTEIQGKPTQYPDAATISNQLGWFLMPAMESDLEGVADNVRSFGGPQENFGVLNTGNTKTNEYAIDFLKYLLSPQGQQVIYATYRKENDAPITLVQLVKNIEIPAEIDYTYVKSAGDCSTSPYLIFGKCSGMTDATVGDTSEYVYNDVAKILSKYFRSTNRTWNGNELFASIKSGFASYATKNNFIYTDPAQVSEKTNGLKNSPYNTAA